MKPFMFFRRNGLYLQDTGAKGRGVFCNELIKTNDIIETSPSVLCNEKEAEHLRHTCLNDYGFTPSSLSPQIYLWANIKDPSKAISFAMGLTSICNHMIDANAAVEFLEEGKSFVLILKAERDIPPDTEICINYGLTWFAKHKGSTWFGKAKL